METRFFILLTLIIATIPTTAFSQNQVLSLDGDGDYVRIPNAPELQRGENLVKIIEVWFMSMRAPFPLIGKARDGINKELNEIFRFLIISR